MSASLSGLALRYQCATSTVFRRTEQPCACMLTVLIERESVPCRFAITSEAGQEVRGRVRGGNEQADAARVAAPLLDAAARGTDAHLGRRTGGVHRLAA